MIIKITAVIEKKGPMIEKKQDAREDSSCMLVVLSRNLSLQLYEANDCKVRCGFTKKPHSPRGRARMKVVASACC